MGSSGGRKKKKEEAIEWIGETFVAGIRLFNKAKRGGEYRRRYGIQPTKFVMNFCVAGCWVVNKNVIHAIIRLTSILMKCESLIQRIMGSSRT
jgi:hypothetical protein